MFVSHVLRFGRIVQRRRKLCVGRGDFLAEDMVGVELQMGVGLPSDLERFSDHLNAYGNGDGAAFTPYAHGSVRNESSPASL